MPRLRCGIETAPILSGNENVGLFQLWGKWMTGTSRNSYERYAILGLGGAVIGLLVGVAMRPAVLGVKIPLEVLSSRFPADAPFRSELWAHLAIYLAAGAGIGLAAAYVVVAMAGSSTQTSVVTGTNGSYDASKWQALVEVDTEIAAEVKRISLYGQSYVDDLAQKYLAISDKNYLSQIANQIAIRADMDLANQQAALHNKDNTFQGYRCFYDEQGSFIGEATPGLGDFHVFPSQRDFEEAVSDYITRGRPPVVSKAAGPVALVSSV